MRHVYFVFLLAFSFVLNASAITTVVPTTTLAKETSNNTSAADSFKTQSNSNMGASNVSKVPMRSLLYPGSTTKLYVHLMAWFGGANHMNVGYASNNATQVARQVDDMMSRGVDGAIVDWYGPNGTVTEQATQMLRNEAAKRGGKFQFAVMEDAGALKTCAATSGCDLSKQVISDLTYAYNQYETSPNYIRSNGRPVVFFFGMDSYTLDWTRIRAGVPGNPLFIFRNSGAFSKSYSDGAFSWLGISGTDPNSMGLSYMDGFYSTALNYPTKLTFGSGYKGFNDTLAGWGSNRIVNQQCGQTWLATMAEAGKYYSASRQLPNVQIVTWNDYEEGSELESGVDNCVTVGGSVTGDNLNWSITGKENTLDHYTVFISTDGQNLMPLADVPAGTHSLDLGQFALDQATYTLYVKAVGKNSIKNQMSAAIKYTTVVSNKPPVAVLAVSPTSGINSVTATASTAGSSDPDGKIVSTSIDFGDGTIVNSSPATHVYTTVGSFTVTATVTDDKGAKDTATATVTVTANQAPQARLSVTPGSGIAPMSVTASTVASTDADGSIQSSSIDFGDGTVVSGSSATHMYASAGTFTVKATVTDDLGATSTATATVTVVANQPPVAALALTPSSGIAPVTVTASTAASTDADGTVASSVINWGDGTSSAGPSATHLYSNIGSFTVTATVTDDRGATSSTRANVVVTANQPPVAALAVTPNSGMAPVTVTASTAASSDADGSVASSVINWGDGTSSAGPNASHIYATAGSYTVTATITDDRGASSKATASVNVNYGVTILAPTEGAATTGQVRVAATVNSSAAVTAIRIYLDSTSVYLVQNVSSIDTVIQVKPGTHKITVQSWDAKGLVQKSAVNVSVANQPPTPMLSLSSLTDVVGTTITASTAASTDADGSISSSTINWGDGTTSNGPTATHVYAVAGVYTVAATVVDDLGATANASASVTATPKAKTNVPPVAVLTLSATTVVAPGSVSASTANSSDADGSIVSSVIHWGDGTTSAGPAASHTYAAVGTYTVTATVVDNQGASSSRSATVNVVGGVTILQPTNNATVSGTVRVVATASSDVSITAVRIYVDNTSVYLINNAGSIDTSVTVSKGTHRITVQSWDKNGVVNKAAVAVNVQ